MALAAMYQQGVALALQPGCRLARPVFRAGDIFLPGDGGQGATLGEFAQQPRRQLGGTRMGQQPAGKHQHRHHRFGRDLRSQGGRHLGHLGEALGVAAQWFGHQQPGPALFGQGVPEAAVVARHLLAQGAGAVEWRFFGGKTQCAFAQHGQLFSAFAVVGGGHDGVGCVVG